MTCKNNFEPDWLLINVPDFIQTISTIIITSLLIPKKNWFWNITKNYNS